MEDGIITLDSERGKEFGFTSDRFDGYLWKVGEYIVVSLIVSHAAGNFRDLVASIQSKGYGVKIPTPLGRMEYIVRKNGYQMQIEEDELMGPVEVWVLEAKPCFTTAT